MLLQFSAKNFASFKDELILDLVPTKDKSHQENVIISDKYKGLNSVAIFGANASGKSNVLKALSIALITIRQSSFIQPNQPIPYIPYALDSKSLTELTEFEFVFQADDGNKYIYGFGHDGKRIYEEYLYAYYSNQPSKIFERSKDRIDYTDAEESSIKPLLGKTPSNKLFITTANAFNYNKVSAAFDWLSHSIDSYGFDKDDNSALESLYLDELNGNTQSKEFTLALLKKADLNIKDFVINRTIIPQGTTGNINLDPNSFVRLNPVNDSYIYSISFYHPSAGESVEDVSFPFGAESFGTQQLFRISVVLNKVINKGSVMIVDELDKSLHPFIVKMLVDQFRDPDINTKGAQLIFTSHDTNQLNLDFYRRDQIYFTSKDYHTGKSELYALSDYSVRKDENIRKAYLIGRYGALPNTYTEELL